ncbi:MAG: DUF2079 domain-containing protein, partial [Candidatus Aenigmatarchaeota archaeon]
MSLNLDDQNKSIIRYSFKNFIEPFEKDHFLFIIFVLFMFYTVGWSYITILRFYSLNATVYDLGLYMQELWLVYNQHWSIMDFFINFLSRGTMFIFFPLSFFNSYPLLLIFQTIWLGIAIFPIYGIGKYYLKSKISALFISSSYLIYFPLAGVNWFDVHNQAFFISLFLLAFYFYLHKKYKLSLIFFILAGITKYPDIFFVSLFSIITLLEIFYIKAKTKNYNKNDYTFILILTIISLILAILSYFLLPVNSSSYTFSNYLHITSTSIFLYMDNKIFTILLLFSPFFMIPFFSKKWILFFIPYLFLLFTSNYYGYIFPSAFMLQYPSQIIPFIYISTITGLNNILNNRVNDNKINNNKIKYFSIKNLFSKHLNNEIKIALAIFLAVLLLAMVYEPYGPLNQYTQENFNLNKIINSNRTAYDNLIKIISLIPKDDPYVIIDDNLPQVLPWIQLNNSPLLVPPTTLTYNFSYKSYTGQWIKPRIDYVIAYVYGGGYHWTLNSPYNLTMYDIVNKLYGSGEYGLVAEASGIVLLERNYTGPMKFYYPSNAYYSANVLNTGSPFYRNDNMICVSNYTTPKGQWSQAWGGPFAYLVPGEYNVTFQLRTTNTSKNNNIDLIVSYYPSNNKLTTLNSTIITGLNFSEPNKWVNISMNIFINNFAQKV